VNLLTDATWIADADAFASLVDELVQEPLYAIDTEFHRERSYYPVLALAQIAWSSGVALVDPFAVDLAPLAAVFEGDGVAVAHAADQDLEVLERACGTIPAEIFDTQLAAGFLGQSSPSLGNLASRLLDVHLPKGDRLTDWTRRPLTPAQQRYAAADVAHLLDLRGAIVDRLEGSGRLTWAEEECELLRTRRRGDGDPDTAWWRVKDARTLRGVSRGVAQTVAAWRERRARAIDQPPRFVLSDLAISTIAHHPPATVGELQDLRGIDGRHVRGPLGAEILAAVQAGLELPAAALRPPPLDDVDRELRPAVTLASAWSSQLAADLRIDATLLATRADLTAFVRGDPDARLRSGWRYELVGEPLRRLVDGDAALAFAGRGKLALEERSGRPFPSGGHAVPPDG
jgi:ribonuclease D